MYSRYDEKMGYKWDDPEIEKPMRRMGFKVIFRGPDGTRTRDLRRDRAAF